MGDEALLESLQKDRGAGLETLLRKYGPLLHYVIGGVLRDPQDAEDCFSEVSLALWQKLDSFDAAKGGLPAWLTAVARNAALNHWKARQRRESHLSAAETEPSHETTPESEVLRKERAERLQSAIQQLSSLDKQLFY